MTRLQLLDATALALIGHDVAMIPDQALGDPTPCDGWTVADLVRHMNERHEAVITTVLPPLDDQDEDPRADFARIAARWVVALHQAGEAVNLPQAGPMAVQQVPRVHMVDMLAHRWDLARALHRTCAMPAGLAEFALPIARANTAPGSPLNGPGGVYHPPIDEDPTLPPIDNIAALLGRDPSWRASEATSVGER